MHFPAGGPGEGSGRDVSDDGGETTPPRYLFPVDGDHPERVLPLVCDLVAAAEAELVIASPVTLPDVTPLEAAEPRREGRRLAGKFALKAKRQCHGGPPIDQIVLSGHEREDILQTMVERYDISTLVTEDQPRSGIRSLLGIEGVDDAVVTDACDTIVFARIEHLGAVESILVPVAGGPHSELAIETGLALARQNGATLELLHVYTAGGDGRARGEEVLAAGMERIGGYELAERTLLEANDVPAAIVEYSRPFDVTVVGAPREGRLRRFVQGSVPDEVNAETNGAVLIARRGGAEESWLDKWI